MNSRARKPSDSKKIEPWVFFPPLIFVVLLCIWVVSDPERAGVLLASAFSFITNQLGWFYEWYIVAVVIVCIFLCVSKVGKKRFGDEKPEFSTFSWLGLIFTSVAGFGVLTWTSIEWFYYYQTPTWGMESYSTEALYWATAYPLHHWGPIIFSIATLMGVLYAYQFYVKKVDDVRPSTTCMSLIGEKKARGWLGKIIDALFAIGLLCSVVTCVGVNVPTLFGIISRVFGSQPTFGAQAAVILAWSVVMALLLYTGLKRGIKLLSDFRVWCGFIILIFLLVIGPTSYLLNSALDNVGMYLQNMIRLTLNTDPYAASGTPQAWTVFYWCWYIALAIQTGIFFARVSRGRTVRQLVIGAIAAQTIGSWIFFGIFMNYSIYIYQTETVDVANIIATMGQGEAIVSLWDHIPFAALLFPVLMVYGFISMQTLLNGNVYSMAMVTTKRLTADNEPPRWNRVFWSLGIGAIAISLLLIGGIRPSQTMTIIGSLPVAIIIFLMVWAFFKDIRGGWHIRSSYAGEETAANGGLEETGDAAIQSETDPGDKEKIESSQAPLK